MTINSSNNNSGRDDVFYLLYRSMYGQSTADRNFASLQKANETPFSVIYIQ